MVCHSDISYNSQIIAAIITSNQKQSKGRVMKGSGSVAGLFVWAETVWASPDVICLDLALAGLTGDICFPTMWPLYFEARWQMMPAKQTTHKYSRTLTIKFPFSQQSKRGKAADQFITQNNL